MGTNYEDLPFRDRPDLTPYLIHLTKNTKQNDKYSAYDNLLSILKCGEIWGSDYKGFIKKGNKATCFMDIPFTSLKYILNEENSSPLHPRYEPYGIFVEKNFAYDEGVRPVLYLSDEEVEDLNIPNEELWRVVKLEVDKNKEWVCWTQEREWRCKGDFVLPHKRSTCFMRPFKMGVLVKTYRDVLKLQKEMRKYPNDFNVEISTILPLDIICQGLYI